MQETNNFEKKRTVRRIDLVLLFCAVVLLLGWLVSNSITGIKNQTKRTDIVLSRQWETLFEQETRSELIREFEEKNPHLRLRLAAPPKTQGTEPPDAAAENGSTALDIIFFDESRFATLLERNALSPLEAEFAETSFAGKNNSGGWAIPLALSMDLLFYNIDLLSAAGFDRPPKTRDEFLRYAQKVSGGETDGIYGAALALSPQDPLSIRRDFFSWFWASGLSLSVDTQPGFDSRAAADIIAFFGQLNQQVGSGKTVLTEGDPFDKTGTRNLEEFAQGKIAMIIAPAQSISFLRGKMEKSSFGVTTIPGTSTPVKNSLGLSGYYAGISATCTHPEEAQVFLAFLAGKSSLLAEKISVMQNSIAALVPPSQGFSGTQEDTDPLYEKAWDIFDSSDIAENFSLVPHSTALEQAIREELRKFFDGGLSAQNTVTAIQKQWDAISGKED